MIVTPLFQEIEHPLTISQKLGLSICNADSAYKEFLLQKLIIEFKQYSRSEQEEPEEFKTNKTIKDILLSEYYADFFGSKDLNSEIECLKLICNNILTISVIECDESMLLLKNQYTINPSCEISEEEKFINFYSFLESHKSFKIKNASINIAYNNHDYGKYTDMTHIIRPMEWRTEPNTWKNNPYRYKTHNEECQYKINSMLAFGKLIDEFIASDDDFFILEFIMDSISLNEISEYTQIVRTTSLLEFLIAKKDYKSLRYEFRKKLPQFLSDYIDEKDKDLWIKIMYDIRSKIAHGDYFGLVKSTEKFAKIFMRDFDYDYYEFSKMNWIVSRINGELSSALARIIRSMLNYKPIITEIKES